MGEFETSELQRRLSRMVMLGTVLELDAAEARVRVAFGGGAESAWLPFAQVGSKDVRIWAPPVVGSQVLVLSPGGETAAGVVIPGPYDGAAPDGAAGAMRISMPGFDMRVEGGTAVIDVATATFSGDVVVDGDVIASGVSLVSHVHGGVTPGGGNSGGPV